MYSHLILNIAIFLLILKHFPTHYPYLTLSPEKKRQKVTETEPRYIRSKSWSTSTLTLSFKCFMCVSVKCLQMKRYAIKKKKNIDCPQYHRRRTFYSLFPTPCKHPCIVSDAREKVLKNFFTLMIHKKVEGV